ncbi:iron-siderophore ABC transporter substrate-binding protein [Robertmurraya sp. DFI.2.37]|uniref:ABC transporter substrate-binding protein n=1 Tax=Robertmurraya sp. DFI.2.37 TaxID=3031819 RepID=UPI0012484586|nr:iron-siderophore ABC transporter substrate-binding protein [Robertmurraya sp. DFI.2.37]MDF1508815.1 iron-siderophore ABC transporter substrate-binding protein [Robertmurraya sp. DFI.2.37]
MQKIGTVFIMLLTIIMLVACGAGETNTSKNQQEKEEQATAVSQVEATEQSGSQDGQMRTITHAMGTTDIEGTPQRAVTLFQGATDAALALGVKPVAAVESWIEQPWYEYIRDQMDGVVNLGDENQPDLEKIAELKPDVIIASKTRHEKISEQLSAIAPTVMTEEVHIWKDTLQLTAEALNKQEEEASFLQQWDEKVADFKKQVGERLNDTEVAVIDFRTDHVRIVYTGFAALVLDELGIPRPDNQKGESWGVKLTTKENIPSMDADILFDQTSTSRDDGRLDLRASWMEHPLWQNLRAVKNNKVYEVDTAVWNNGSGPIAATLMLEDLYEYFELEK